MKTFTKETCENLKETCEKIYKLLDESDESGSLTYSQLVILGENIKDFIENPIIQNSSIGLNF